LNFISVEFFLFFTLLFIIHFSIPQQFRWVLLLFGSMIFYGSINLKFFLTLIIPFTFVIFFLTKKMSDTENLKSRKKLLYINLILSIGILAIFKYFNFFGNIVYNIIFLIKKPGTYSPVNIFFPIGISFFIFKTISYIVDIYRKDIETEKHFGYFLLYISFFPQMLAGPIDRASKFIPELRKKSNIDINRIISGLRQIIWGIFKKAVIADRLAIFINNIYQNPSGHQGVTLIITAYFYSFQIYCDFSAYSDIAIGLSKILGYKSMINFNFPYFSKSISDFWTRWHISLSTWLRDYLFLPIAYYTLRKNSSEKTLGIKTETWSYISGMFITMFLAGLWHGAGWTFIFWGLLHGFFLIIGHVTKKKKRKILRKLKLFSFPHFLTGIRIFITFNMVTFAWIFFRSTSISNGILYIKSINFKYNGEGAGHILFNTLLVVFFILIEYILKNKNLIKEKIKIPMIIQSISYALFICLIIILFIDKSQEFIYFKF